MIASLFLEFLNPGRLSPVARWGIEDYVMERATDMGLRPKRASGWEEAAVSVCVLHGAGREFLQKGAKTAKIAKGEEEGNF
jgi:hypothetical protein